MPNPWRTAKRLLGIAGYGLGGALIAGLVTYGIHLQNRPDLAPWHRAFFDQEFRAGSAEETTDLAAYLQLEERLFEELDQKVYRQVPAKEGASLNRFAAGSLADPRRYAKNWNRTFEFPAAAPRAGVLLLHGLSDSPYSLRALAESLRSKNAWVLGLRLPGHGTAPSGLVDVEWQDFAAAVRLAARHLAAKLPEGQPLYIVGYSLGAALAVQYALDVQAGADLPRPAGLLLISPALGVTRAAALAIWQMRASALTGLEKLAWNDILPEYDPFKYNSFPLNAGEEIYQLTLEIDGRLEQLSAGGGLKGFPPVLVFQSLADATVLPGAPADRLLRRLAAEGHELALFDVNRVAEVNAFLRPEKGALREELIAAENLPFALTLVTNRNEETLEAVAKRFAPSGGKVEEVPLGLSWPANVYSLSHVALPFPPDDPLYGYAAKAGPGLHLGRLEPRGERGYLIVGANQMLRLRGNPFFPYIERRMLSFFGLENLD